METSIWKRELYFADKVSSNPALEKPERKIDEIAAPEDLNERTALAFSNAVVKIDHRRHFGLPTLAIDPR